MEYNNLINKIFEGNCILFTGSGFSFGAKNINTANPKMKGAGMLSEMLLGEIGSNSNVTDLRKASAAYLRKKPADELIKILKREFTVTEISPSHKVIGSCPWFRLYTTNYDDVIETSYKLNHKVLTPITLSTNPNNYPDKSLTCVHLNGYIHDVTPDKLSDEFKLTNASYLTTDFLGSKWIDYFRSDILACDAIFFVGFSMDYDLDLARIIASPSISDKTVFIVKDDEDELNIDALSEFGIVKCIGTDGFAEDVAEAKRNFVASPIKNFCPLSFSRISIDKNYMDMRDEYFHSLLLTGAIRDNFVYRSLTDRNTLLYTFTRSKLDEVCNHIESGCKNLLVESSLGNGKTVFLRQIAIHLTSKGYKVFWFKRFTARFYSEVQTLAKDFSDAVVILDDYHTVRSEIGEIRKQSPDLCIVTSERTALHDVIFDEIEDVLDSDYITINIDKLDETESRDVDVLLDKYSLWGDLTTSHDRLSYIMGRCDAQLKNLILSRLSSPYLETKIKSVLNTIQKAKSYSDVFQTVILAECFHIRIEMDDIVNLVGADILNKPSFRRNPEINEFINVEDYTISFKSSIVARHILINLQSPSLVIDALINLARMLSSHSSNGNKNKDKLISLTTFSSIQSSINITEPGWKSEIFRFYETMKEDPACKDNIHFWLQYAIARLYDRNYPVAKSYFDKCYALAKKRKNYQTYKIDNHYCRFILSNEIENGTNGTCMDAFRHAHSILYNTRRGDEKKHYPYKVAGLYEQFFSRFYKDMTKQERVEFIGACEAFLKKCEDYLEDKNCTNPRIVKDTKKKLEDILTQHNLLSVVSPN